MARKGKRVNIKINSSIVGRKALRAKKNRQKATLALSDRLTVAWRDGAASFIQEVMKKLLVDTGMSAATFLELSGAIKRRSADSAIQGRLREVNRVRENRYKHAPQFPDGNRDSGPRQSRFTGEALGRRAYIFQVPKFTASTPLNKRRVAFNFSFRHATWQHAYWDEKLYNTLEAGIQAFRETIDKRFVQEARFVVGQFLRGKPIVKIGILE